MLCVPKRFNCKSYMLHSVYPTLLLRFNNFYFYILDLISSNSAFNLSISVGCWGHPIVKPSVSFGLGI